MKKTVTPEQRAEIISRVDALKKEGLSLEEAWAKEGIGHSQSYYAWKSKAPKKKRAYRQRSRKIVVEDAPAPHLVALIGFWSDGNVTNMQDLKRAA